MGGVRVRLRLQPNARSPLTRPAWGAAEDLGALGRGGRGPDDPDRQPLLCLHRWRREQLWRRLTPVAASCQLSALLDWCRLPTADRVLGVGYLVPGLFGLLGLLGL